MIATHGFHVTMTAQPGRREELIEVLLGGASTGPASCEACVVFLVGRSASNPDVVYVTEGWTSAEAHEEVLAIEATQVYRQRVRSLVADITQIVDEIPVGGRTAFAS